MKFGAVTLLIFLLLIVLLGYLNWENVASHWDTEKHVVTYLERALL